MILAAIRSYDDSSDSVTPGRSPKAAERLLVRVHRPVRHLDLGPVLGALVLRMFAGSPANSSLAVFRPSATLSSREWSIRIGTGNTLMSLTVCALICFATFAAPSIPCVLRVKQSITVSGRWSVQMLAISERPVLLSIRIQS